MSKSKKVILLLTAIFLALGIIKIFYLETMEHDPFGTAGTLMYGVVKWLN